MNLSHFSTPQILFEREKKSLTAYFRKEFKKLENKREKLKKNLKECTFWGEVKHEGDLLKASYSAIQKGMNEIKVWDWLKNNEKILQLDPKLTAQELIAKRYHRAKKLRRGINHLEGQLDLTDAKILDCLSKMEALDQSKSLEDLILIRPPLRKQASPKEVQKKKSLPYHEYRSETGILIWVGKNARSNEKLTFALANGNDWWLHANGVSGSHVIIRTLKGKDPDQETIEDALQLALFHSKAKAGKEGEVCVAQKKFVSRYSGKSQPGKVQISKHKTLRVRLDERRLQVIKNRHFTI